jgi:hypothetical protein
METWSIPQINNMDYAVLSNNINKAIRVSIAPDLNQSFSETTQTLPGGYLRVPSPPPIYTRFCPVIHFVKGEFLARISFLTLWVPDLSADLAEAFFMRLCKSIGKIGHHNLSGG